MKNPKFLAAGLAALLAVGTVATMMISADGEEQGSGTQGQQTQEPAGGDTPEKETETTTAPPETSATRVKTEIATSVSSFVVTEESIIYYKTVTPSEDGGETSTEIVDSAGEGVETTVTVVPKKDNDGKDVTETVYVTVYGEDGTTPVTQAVTDADGGTVYEEIPPEETTTTTAATTPKAQVVTTTTAEETTTEAEETTTETSAEVTEPVVTDPAAETPTTTAAPAPAATTAAADSSSDAAADETSSGGASGGASGASTAAAPTPAKMTTKTDKDGKTYVSGGSGTGTVVTISDKVDYVSGGAFRGNKYIKEVTVAEDCEFIGAKAFYNCKNLTKVVIKGNTEIKDGAFLKCPKLTLYVEKGSPAEAYAKANKIKYKYIED